MIEAHFLFEKSIREKLMKDFGEASKITSMNSHNFSFLYFKLKLIPNTSWENLVN